MKLNITVDLEDLFVETREDGEIINIQEEIKSEIVSKVKSEVWALFSKTAKEEINTLLIREITSIKDILITEKIRELLISAKIRKSTFDKSEITVTDYILEQLKGTYGETTKTSNEIDKVVSNNAHIITNQLKNRYDMLFASQLVNNMKQAGMLKDDVAKLLLPEKEQ